MRAQLEKILQKFIRSHTICKRTTRCNCRLSTEPRQMKLQVEEHFQHSSETVSRTLPLLSPSSAEFSARASLAAVIAGGPSGAGRSMGLWAQPLRLLPRCLLKPFEWSFPTPTQGRWQCRLPHPPHTGRSLQISCFPPSHFETEGGNKGGKKLLIPQTSHFTTVNTSQIKQNN